jgi:excisionase family DNA binding protein
MKEDEKLNGVPWVARRLSVERSWVYMACAKGVLPHIKVGRYLRFAPSEVEEWLAKQRGGPRD